MRKLTLIIALALLFALVSCSANDAVVTTPSESYPTLADPAESVTAPDGAVTSQVGGGDVVVVSTSSQAETTDPTLDRVDDVVIKGEVSELPQKDYSERLVNFLIRTEWAYEFTEGSGDIVVDEAIYDMVVNVEDEYNVKLNLIEQSGAWGNRAAFTNAVHNSVLAEDGAYDAVFTNTAFVCDGIVQGDYANLLDLPYLQLGQDWWSQAAVDSLTLNGRCYMASGDLTLTLWQNLYCMFFNKTMAAEYSLPDLYALVDSGDWTHDKMAEYAMLVSEDLNQNDALDLYDKYGLIGGGNALRHFIVAYDTPILSVNSDDVTLAWNTERTVTVIEKLVTLFSNDSAYNNSNYTDHSSFRAGNVLFQLTTLGYSTSLRSSDVDFGIIPYPKLDKSQPGYYNCSNDVSMFCVPVTAPDPEMTALIVEALCREGYTTVAPAFCETVVKGKYVDEESGRMLDLIRDDLRYDFGWVHSTVLNLGNSYQMFVDGLNTDFASYYESRVDEYTENIKSIRSLYFD